MSMRVSPNGKALTTGTTVRNMTVRAADVREALGENIPDIEPFKNIEEKAQNGEQITLTPQDRAQLRQQDEQAYNLILPHVRSEQTHETVREVAEKSLDENFLAGIREEARQATERNTEHTAEMDTIRADISQKFAEAKIGKSKTTSMIGDMAASFFDSMSRAFGISPAELYQRFGLSLFTREKYRDITSSKDAGDPAILAQYVASGESFTIWADPHTHPATILHEVTHWFSDVMQRLNNEDRQVNGKGKFDGELQSLVDWCFGENSGKNIDSLTPAERTRMEEAFAYAMQAYIVDGKIPKLDANLFGRLATLVKTFLNPNAGGGKADFHNIRATYERTYGSDLPPINDKFDAVVKVMGFREEAAQHIKDEWGGDTVLKGIETERELTPAEQAEIAKLTAEHNAVATEMAAEHTRNIMRVLFNMAGRQMAPLRKVIREAIRKNNELFEFVERQIKGDDEIYKQVAALTQKWMDRFHETRDGKDWDFLSFNGINLADARAHLSEDVVARLVDLNLAHETGRVMIADLHALNRKTPDWIMRETMGGCRYIAESFAHDTEPVIVAERAAIASVVSKMDSLKFAKKFLDAQDRSFVSEKITAVRRKINNLDLKLLQKILPKKNKKGTLPEGVTEEHFKNTQNLVEQVSVAAAKDALTYRYKDAHERQASNAAGTARTKANELLRKGDVVGAARELIRERYQIEKAHHMQQAKDQFNVRREAAHKILSMSDKKIAEGNFDLSILNVARLLAGNIGIEPYKINVAEARRFLMDAGRIEVDGTGGGIPAPIYDALIGILDRIQENKDFEFTRDFREQTLLQNLNHMDMISDIIQMARAQKTLLRDNKAKTIDAVVKELGDTLSRHEDEWVEPSHRSGNEIVDERNKSAPRHVWEDFRKGFRTWTKKVETMLQQLDGQTEGALHDNFYNRASHADVEVKKGQVEVTLRVEKAMKKLDAKHAQSVPRVIESSTLRRLDNAHIQSFGSNSFWASPNQSAYCELLAAIMHMGSRESMDAFLLGLLGQSNELRQGKWADGRDMTPSEIEMKRAEERQQRFEMWDKFFKEQIENGTITKDMMDFCADIGKLHDEYGRKVSKVMYETTGRSFEYKDKRIIHTKWGDYEGWYSPSITNYDRLPPDKLGLKEHEIIAGHPVVELPSKARAPHGFTEQISMGVERERSLDLNRLLGQLNAEVEYIYKEPVLHDIQLLMNSKYNGTKIIDIMERKMSGARDIYTKWLKDWGENKSYKLIDSFGRLNPAVTTLHALTNTMIMSGNMANAITQVTGLVVAMSRMKPRELINAATEVMTMGHEGRSAKEIISSESEWMAMRLGERTDGIMEYLTKTVFDESIVTGRTIKTQTKKFNDFMVKNAYWMQKIVQNQIDKVVYVGARNDYVHKTFGEEVNFSSLQGAERQAAIDHACEAVRSTQASFDLIDKTAVERGNPFMKLFTAFYNYFGTMLNLYQSQLQFVNSGGKPLTQRVLNSTAVYMTVIAVPSLIAQAITEYTGGRLTSQDDEIKHAAWSSILMSPFITLSTFVPFVGGIGADIMDKLAGRSWYSNARYSIPVMTTLAAGGASFLHAGQALVGDRVMTGNDWRNMGQALAIALRAPYAGWPSRSFGYMWDVGHDYVDPASWDAFMIGVLTGRKDPASFNNPNR